MSVIAVDYLYNSKDWDNIYVFILFILNGASWADVSKTILNFRALHNHE